MRVTKTELKRLIKEELEAVLKEEVDKDLTEFDLVVARLKHWEEKLKKSERNSREWNIAKKGVERAKEDIATMHHEAHLKALQATEQKKADAEEAMKVGRQANIEFGLVDPKNITDEEKKNIPAAAVFNITAAEARREISNAMAALANAEEDYRTNPTEQTEQALEAAYKKVEQYKKIIKAEEQEKPIETKANQYPKPNDWVGSGYREVASAVKNITGLKSLKGGWWRKPLPEGKCNDPEFCYTEGRRAGRMKRNHPVRVAFRKYYNARKGKKRKPKKQGPMKFYPKGGAGEAGAIEAIKKGEEAVLVVDDNQKEVSRIKDIDEAIGIVMGNINASDDKGDRKESRAARKELRRLKVAKRALAKKANKKAGLGDLYKRAGKRKRVPSSQLTKKQQNLQTKAK